MGKLIGATVGVIFGAIVLFDLLQAAVSPAASFVITALVLVALMVAGIWTAIRSVKTRRKSRRIEREFRARQRAERQAGMRELARRGERFGERCFVDWHQPREVSWSEVGSNDVIETPSHDLLYKRKLTLRRLMPATIYRVTDTGIATTTQQFRSLDPGLSGSEYIMSHWAQVTVREIDKSGGYPRGKRHGTYLLDRERKCIQLGRAHDYPRVTTS
jgi:hypothetical protein